MVLRKMTESLLHIVAIPLPSCVVVLLKAFVWVGLNSVLSESHITDLARIFFTLKMSLKKLTAYYKSLRPTGNPAGTHYFPSITALYFYYFSSSLANQD